MAGFPGFDAQRRRLIGNRINTRRNERGWSQADLGRKARVSLTTIERAEAGNETVTLRTVRLIAEALETSLERIAAPDDVLTDASRARVEASHDPRPTSTPPTEQAHPSVTNATTIAQTTIADAADASPWLVEVVARLQRVVGFMPCVDRLPAGAPDSARAELLELAPLLIDWPRRVLMEEDEWSCLDTPLPSIKRLPLDEAWVELTIRPLYAERSSGVELPDPLDRSADEYSWLDLAQAPEFIIDRMGVGAVVFGRPGSGKTSFLKWLTRETLRTSSGQYLTPLFVRLRELAKARRRQPGLDLLSFALEDFCRIRDPRQRERWVRALSLLAGPTRGNVLFLLDGWDELDPADREDLEQELERHGHGFGMILSSRHTVPPAHMSTDFHFEIADLTPSASDDLIQRWFSALDRSWQGNELRLLLARQPTLAQLARNPFTLTLLCALAHQGDPRRPVQLPTTRSDVYERAIDLVIRHHNDHPRESTLPLTPGRVRKLETLARWLYEEADDAPRFVFEASDVELATHDPDLLSRTLHPSRLVCQAEGRHGSYHFVHTTYHEYFVAQGLGRISTGLLEHLRPHLLDTGWFVVMLFLLGGHRGSPQARELLVDLASHRDRFGHVHIRVAQLLGELGVRDGGRALLGYDVRDELWAGILRGVAVGAFRDAYVRLDPEHLVDRTITAGDVEDSQLSARMGRLLRELPSARAVEALKADLAGEDRNRASVATSGGARVFTTRDLEELRALAADDARPHRHRINVITLLGNIRDLGALDVLRDMARGGPMAAPAIEAIGRMGGERAATVLCELLEAGHVEEGRLYSALGATRSVRGRKTLLDALARRELDDDRAPELLEALLEIPIGTEDALASITRHLRGSHEISTRELAASVLASASAAGVGELLVSVAREDPAEVVRAAALESLVEHPDPLRVNWLRGIWRDRTRDSSERERAIKALLASVATFARSWNWAHLALDVLEDIELALADADGSVRLAAIARADAAGPRAIPLLVSVLSNDSQIAQEEACRTLARMEGHESATALRRVAGLATAKTYDEDEMLLDPAVRASAEAARALAQCEPTMLLDLRNEAASAALERYAIEHGSLVFDEHIIDARGRRLNA